jgi:hypothetical protein
MDRLMCLQIDSSGEAVEALVNGMPVARLPAGGGSRCVTVHEYLLAGANRIALTVAPPPLAQPTASPQPRLATTASGVRARLMLLRQGKRADDDARVLGEVSWAVAEGASFEAPASVEQTLDLPVTFARWRWLDAPVISPGPAERQLVLGFVQRLAFDLSRGNPEALINASRLKFEELALAYQWPAEQAQARLRAQVQQLYEAKALPALAPPTAEGLLLRPVAGGRLLDCLTPLGTPVLSLPTDAATGATQAWPLRLALVEGKAYVLR